MNLEINFLLLVSENIEHIWHVKREFESINIHIEKKPMHNLPRLKISNFRLIYYL